VIIGIYRTSHNFLLEYMALCTKTTQFSVQEYTILCMQTYTKMLTFTMSTFCEINVHKFVDEGCVHTVRMSLLTMWHVSGATRPLPR